MVTVPKRQGTQLVENGVLDGPVRRADLAEKIITFANRYNRTASPWTWHYDARADHARYQARHSHNNTADQPLPTAT